MRNLGVLLFVAALRMVGDVVITGSSIGDNRAVDVERGVARAYDVRTGGHGKLGTKMEDSVVAFALP